MARNRNKRRQQHGAAWPLLDGEGQRIRSKDNKKSAELALARVKLANELNSPSPAASSEWTVARTQPGPGCGLAMVEL